MERRNLLKMLMAGLVMDPERLLWVPGRKMISIPKPALRHVIILINPGYNIRPWLDQAMAYTYHLDEDIPRVGRLTGGCNL